MNNELNFGREEEIDLIEDLIEKIENEEWRMNMKEFVDGLKNKNDATLKEDYVKYRYLYHASHNSEDRYLYHTACVYIQKEARRRNIELKEND